MIAARGAVRRTAALARFAIASNLGRWMTRGGLIAGAAVMALGSFLSVQQGTGWRFDDDFGFMGFFVMALFAVRSGLEEQRELGLTTFTARNLAHRLEHALGFVCASLAIWMVVSLGGFLGVVIASGGDLATAAWTVTAWGLRLLILLGFVPLVEAVASIRLPLILPGFAYLGAIVALTLLLSEERAFLLIVVTQQGDIGSYARLAGQATVSFLVTSAVFVTVYSARPGLRNRLRSIVPIRH